MIRHSELVVDVLEKQETSHHVPGVLILYNLSLETVAVVWQVE